jgi:hypothetical protein
MMEWAEKYVKKEIATNPDMVRIYKIIQMWLKHTKS